jgi:glycosyltransferase involved in cell wall biosynthesis
MTMRVLHVYAGNLYGGVEAMLATFARERSRAPEMEPRFALCFEGRLSAELREIGTAPEMLGGARLSLPWTVARVRRRFREVIEADRPSVVVCHSAWSHAIFAPVAREVGIPLVFWLHDAVSGRTREERRARSVDPDLAVCTSEYARGTLPALFPHVRAEVVYPSVPPPPRISRNDRRTLREELRTHWADVVIVQVARMEEWKGHRLLLEALARLREVPGWTLWLVGGEQRRVEATYRTGLARLALRFGIAPRVRFLGERSDVPRVLGAADVLCQPNLGPEPFGMAMVEALYAGLPVVATDLGGAREIVDSSCGIRVPPGDPAALADALRTMILDAPLADTLASAGPARARALCDPETQMRRLSALLADVAKDDTP